MNIKQKLLAFGGVASGAFAALAAMASTAHATVLDATTTVSQAGTDASDTFLSILTDNIPKIVVIIVVIVGFSLLVRMFRRHSK